MFDYTALTWRSQGIYEAFDPTDNSPDRIVYRYKENVPVLSNLTGATRVSGAVTTLYLSREIPAPAASDAVEALVLSAGALEQLTSDNPGATLQTLANDATKLPVFVNQGDAAPITPPAGVTGAPARGIQLSPDIADNVFALMLTLTAVRGGNDAFSFVDGAGAPKMPWPVFNVRFKNRSTLWTYLDKQTGAVTATEAAPLPLTRFRKCRHQTEAVARHREGANEWRESDPVDFGDLCLGPHPPERETPWQPPMSHPVSMLRKSPIFRRRWRA